MATTERKEYPIAMRLPAADVAMIDRAANLRGRSRTDFVREAAVRAAEEVVMEQRLIRMAPEGFADFVEVLSRPAGPVPEIVELADRPATWGSRLHGKAVRVVVLGSGAAHRRA